MTLKNNFLHSLCYLVLFFVVTQFMNMQVYSSIVLLLITLLAMQVMKGKLEVVPTLLWLVLIGTFICYFMVYKQNHEVKIYQYITYLIGPPAFYYCGMVLMKKNIADYRQYYENVMLILSVGGSLYGIACVINKYVNIGTYTYLFSSQGLVSMMEGRYALDVWTNTLLHPTNLNSYCIFAIISWSASRKFVEKRWKSVIFNLSAILAILVCFMTGSRTNLYFFALSILIMALVTHSYGRKKGLIKVTKNKLVMGIIIVAVLLLFSEPLLDLLQSSELWNRLSGSNITISNDGRWERMSLVFEHILDYPMGNMPYSEAHNIWLDTARVSGILPMILMIIFTVGCLISAGTVYKNKKIDLAARSWMMETVIILFMSFQIEPVLEGRPYIFMLFCFAAGMIKTVEKVPVRFNSEEYFD